jgi:hypothetical protein
MTVIDKRAIPLTVTFGDLAIGEAFQDCNNELCIKTDIGTAMLWYEEKGIWIPKYSYEEDELIIPLEITYKIERKNKQ